MMQMDDLELAVSHLQTARPALARTIAKVRAGTLGGLRVNQPQCAEACEECYLRCAVMVGVVADLEARVERMGGITIAGVSYAFAGRA